MQGLLWREESRSDVVIATADREISPSPQKKYSLILQYVVLTLDTEDLNNFACLNVTQLVKLSDVLFLLTDKMEYAVIETCLDVQAAEIKPKSKLTVALVVVVCDD